MRIIKLLLVSESLMEIMKASQLSQWVKNSPAMQETHETPVQALGWEDLLEEDMVNYSILTWKIPWTEEPGGLQFMRLQRVRYNWSSWACTHAHRAIKTITIEFEFFFNLFMDWDHIGYLRVIKKNVTWCWPFNEPEPGGPESIIRK